MRAMSMSKIILALEKKEHFKVAHEVQDYVDGWKINHIGWEIISQSRADMFAPLNRYRLSNDKEVFVDFKLWDTPNTMKTVDTEINTMNSAQLLSKKFVLRGNIFFLFNTNGEYK